MTLVCSPSHLVVIFVTMLRGKAQMVPMCPCLSFFQQVHHCHKVPCSVEKNPPSFFFLLLSLWTLQHTAATISITTPAHSRATDTTLVWSNVLNLKVTPVPAIPITKDMTPNGKTQRYQDFSVPPVACASLSRVGRDSGCLDGSLQASPTSPFKPWFWLAESSAEVLLASVLVPQSRSG